MTAFIKNVYLRRAAVVATVIVMLPYVVAISAWAGVSEFIKTFADEWAR